MDTTRPNTDPSLIETADEIITATGENRPDPRFRIADYGTLLKPRVMTLVVFTAMVGMVLAPGPISPVAAVMSIVCIFLGAGASGAINMWYDRDIDLQMSRTQNRPIPAGRMKAAHALIFGIVLGFISVALMAWTVNWVTAVLLAVTILYYVVIYTVWLKRRTPQNIVIGGASGALPPVIGWASVTGDVGLGAIILFMIIFLWTPPHSWALALFRRGDYTNAGVPMLPVVAGVKETKRQMVLYTIAMVPTTLAPAFFGMAGGLYLAVTVLLNIIFVRHLILTCREDQGDGENRAARPLFFYSIFYLFAIFVALLADQSLFVPVF